MGSKHCGKSDQIIKSFSKTVILRLQKPPAPLTQSEETWMKY